MLIGSAQHRSHKPTWTDGQYPILGLALLTEPLPDNKEEGEHAWNATFSEML